MKKLQLTLAVAMLLVFQNAFAEKMTVAVLDLEAKGVTTIVSGAVTDMIRSDMVDAGVFSVVERGQMNQILKEQGFQATGCTDQACAVQVGKLLSAKKILVGEVTPVGKNILITVRIVDVEKGVADFSARETALGEDALDEASRKISAKLVNRIAERTSFWEKIFGRSSEEPPKKIEPKTTEESSKESSSYSMSGYYLRSIVPGWGQLYAGKTWKGIGFMSAFTASAAFSVWAIMDYGKKKKAYDDLAYGEPKSEFDSKWNAYQKASTVSLISVGIVGAIYLANWIDVLFFTTPDSNRLGNSGVSDDGVFVSLDPLIMRDGHPEQGMIMSVGLRF